jgi:hypothetical protein
VVAANLPIDSVCGPKRAWGLRARSFARSFADERGMTLVMALLMMVVLTSVSTTTIYYVTSNVHSTGISKASTSAYDVAEAGLNDSVAKMYDQLDTDGSVLTGGIDPRSTTMFPSCVGTTPPTPTTITYANVGGTALICGDYNATATATTITVAGVATPLAPFTWRIQSVGRVSSAGKMQSRTLSKSLEVVGLNDGANGSAWSRFYQDTTASCLTIDNQQFVTSIAARGDLCLTNGGSISGANTIVDVGGNVTITGPVVTTTVHSPTAATGWTNPTNVFSNNGVYATTSLTTGSTSVNQDTTGFGLAVPATARILGITATVESLASQCCNIDAVQAISESGNPTGGTFKLSGTPPGGSATISGSISATSTAANVQSALVSIYGTGNVTCLNGPLPAAVNCTFVGSDASTPVTLMSLSSKALTGGSSPNVGFSNTTSGVGAVIKDTTVQLLKAGSPVGTNKASGATWDVVSNAIPYGSTSDMWGTTWTPADVNASNFGLRFVAKNFGAKTATASIDYVSITVTYNDDTNGIGVSGTPIKTANIGGSCTYNAQSAHTPCTATDHVRATTVTTTSAANNPALVMPSVDFNYWWANAMPGPKHYCTYKTGTPPAFDNDAALAGTAPDQYTTGNTTGPNHSLASINGEFAPAGQSYVCQVWSIPPQGGTLLGELSWNSSTHVLTIFGTIFVDGNFRFDEDGEIVNYKGRATLMSSTDDEIDAVVCADGNVATPPTTATGSCVDKTAGVSNMPTWDPTKNMMVLMSEGNATPPDNEYDQGGTTCSGNNPPSCFNGHPPGGFQGILYSTGDCEIHQQFQDSGPVICNSLSLPDESGGDPSYYTFPSIGNLTDGQKYSNTITATNFELDPGAQTGG